jgi:beta-phosphoglucomutase family hydrolase
MIRMALDAVIFDMDGVITDTARVHAAAWKTLFDEFLASRAQARGGMFVPFDACADYIKYVDGRSRNDGVVSFLQSRGVVLPTGRPDDRDGWTVWSLSNRKDALFRAALEANGVPVFQSSIQCVENLRTGGMRCAVASSSRNCRLVLRSAGLERLFSTTVDGLDLDALGLRGKPAPDLFVHSALTLGLDPPRCAVVEDSVAGVQAARRGGFGLVVAVDRTGSRRRLAAAGADVIVTDLSELPHALDSLSRQSLQVAR